MLFFRQGKFDTLPFSGSVFLHLIIKIMSNLFMFRKKVLFSDTVGFISDLPVQVPQKKIPLKLKDIRYF